MEPVYGVARVIAYPLRPLFRIRLRGKENIPRTGPVLLASNHVSFLDPIGALWVGEKSHRKIRFLAMAELWNKRVLHFFLVHTHQIPVTRASTAAAGSLNHALEALGRGECIVIYPEGGISGDLELLPGKTGVARLAALSGVPVTPMAIWGTQRIYPKNPKMGRKRPCTAVTIVIGDEKVAVSPDEDVFAATDRIMAGVASCLAEARRIYFQHPKVKKKRWWRKHPRDDTWWERGPETAVMKPSRRDRVGDRWS